MENSAEALQAKDQNEKLAPACDSHVHSKQESDISITCSATGRLTNLKEESSDESTIISSQTSTLTRNHGEE